MKTKNLQMKRLMSATLLILLLNAVGLTKVYAYDFITTSPSGHDIAYTIINSDAKTVRTERHWDEDINDFYKCSGAVVIPSSVGYEGNTYTVTEIGAYTFQNNNLMTSVAIPSSVTGIGYCAFENCTGLTGTLTIGETITNVEAGAFSNTGYSVLNYNAIRMCTNDYGDVCNYAAPKQDFINEENGWIGYCDQLTTINIGDQVEVIPARAFCYCHFAGELTIPNSVTIIGPNAFYHCQQLTGTLTIPESVLKIGDGAFCFCEGLTTLNFNAASYDGDAGCYYGYFPQQASGENEWFGSCPLLKTLNIGEAVTKITNTLFAGCHFEGAVSIPNSVTSVEYDAFSNCAGITEVTIGEGVTSLGARAFTNCTSLATIHYNAINCADFTSGYGKNGTFLNCDALRTLTIGNNVQTIPANSFGFTSLAGSITIPNSVTEIRRGAFMNCSNITTVTIGEGLKKAVDDTDNGIFAGCTGLETINYNAINCTDWNEKNWTDCPLTTLTIGLNVENIPDGIFKGSSFACNLVLPNSLLTIGEQAFKDCSGFTGDLIIPENVTTIGGNAFNGCSGFTGDLTIGNAVETIGEYAFANCTGLQGTLTIGESFSSCPGTWGKPFDNCSGLTTLNYNAINASLPGWYWLNGCTSLATLNIGPNVQVIPERAFMNLNFNNDIVIPNTVTTIGYEAFRDCDQITNITIGEGVTSLAGSAIKCCDGLTTIHYNAINCNVGNTTIGNGWLYDCPMATTLTIGDHVQSIFKGAFSKREISFIGNLVLPNSLQTIGEEAFLNCTGLIGNLVIPNSVTTIEKNAFNGCTGFNGTITLPATMISIGEAAFKDCRNITGTLTLPAGLVTIEREAFRDMSSLTGNLVIPNSVEEIKQQAFYNCSGFNGQLVIGESVETMYSRVFQNAKNFTSLKVKRSVPPANPDGSVFQTWTMTLPVYVPCDAAATYQAADYWNNFTNYQEQPMIDLFVASDDESLGTAAVTQQPTCSNNQATVTATANTGYMFSNWTEGNEIVSTSNPYTFSLTATRNLVAHFEVITYVITVTATPAAGGTVTGDGGYGEGATATLTATANTGYTFVNWTKGGVEVSTDASYSFTVTEEGAYVANFSLNSYDISASADPATGGAVIGDDTYDYGTVATLTATANTGYTFVNWTKGGVEVSTDASYSFTVTEEGAYVANFSLNSYDIFATANPVTHGTVSGAGTYNYGATCTLTATSGQGYRFVNWTENNDVVSTNATYQFTVDSNRDLVANFEEHVIINHYICDISQFADYMSVVAVVVIDGVEQESEALEIGAFSGDVCRGSKVATYFPPTQRYIYQLPVYGAGGDAISFKLYNHDIQQELDLTCTVELQWLKDGYGRLANPYELTFVSSVNIAATVNPENAGNVSGIGDYLPGTIATLTATANEGYVFSNWTENNNVVSGDATYSFTVTTARNLVANFSAMQSYTLNSGWNWWSTYIEQNGVDGLSMLENGLGEHGEFIQSRTGAMVENFDGAFWWGDLGAITNEDMYEIKTNAQTSVAITGNKANSSSHPITLVPGWNWIGYVSNTSNSVDNALSSLTPNEDDIIQGRNGFSSYFPGWGWYGDIENMTPGQGYMYKLTGMASQVLVYPAATRLNQTKDVDYQYSVNYNKYRDVMDVMANVVVNGEDANSSRYELAAFVDGECRGSAKLQYVEPMDTYLAFLTINGNADEKITFTLYDEDLDVTYDASEGSILTFKAKEVVGKFSNPYVLFFNNNETIENPFTVYPNPVTKGEEITINFKENVTEATMFVENGLGETVTVVNLSGKSSKVILNLTSGVYVLRVITNGQVYINRVILK